MTERSQNSGKNPDDLCHDYDSGSTGNRRRCSHFLVKVLHSHALGVTEKSVQSRWVTLLERGSFSEGPLYLLNILLKTESYSTYYLYITRKSFSRLIPRGQLFDRSYASNNQTWFLHYINQKAFCEKSFRTIGDESLIIGDHFRKVRYKRHSKEARSRPGRTFLLQ
jgi:hypothetical protein